MPAVRALVGVEGLERRVCHETVPFDLSGKDSAGMKAMWAWCRTMGVAVVVGAGVTWSVSLG